MSQNELADLTAEVKSIQILLARLDRRLRFVWLVVWVFVSFMLASLALTLVASVIAFFSR